MSGASKSTLPAGEESVSDFELVEKLAKGDAAPLGELYIRHGRVVVRMLRRYAPRLAAAEVEDLAQDVFIKALEVAPRFQRTGSVRGWLCGIAVRVARGRQRRGWVRSALLMRFATETAPAPAAGNAMDAALHARREVEQALAALPAPQREVLLLHVLENLSGEEIAAALGISSKTVWTRLHRARQRMRQVLERGKGDEP